MPGFVAFLGALFLTFLMSRLLLKLLAGVMQGLPRIIVSHILSFALLGLFAAMVKANVETFREDAVLIYILPQLIWMILDLTAQGTLRFRRR